MKRLFLIIIAAVAGTSVFAQSADVQAVAAEAAQAVSDASETEVNVAKPKNWTTSLKTQINVGQTGLFNWAAGGDNTVSLAAFIDGNANWKKDDMFWNNRLQLDYGFLYASSKPLLQKSTDRIYLESKWGYKAPSTNYLYFSANYDFKSPRSNTKGDGQRQGHDTYNDTGHEVGHEGCLVVTLEAREQLGTEFK